MIHDPFPIVNTFDEKIIAIFTRTSIPAFHSPPGRAFSPHSGQLSLSGAVYRRKALHRCR